MEPSRSTVILRRANATRRGTVTGEKAKRRECRDCTYWSGWDCTIGDVFKEKKESRGCDFFIRDSLRYAFFAKV